MKQYMKKQMSKQQGFSLIELMAVIVVIGITLRIGVPSYQAFITNSNLTTYTNNFVTAVSLARTEAVRAGRNINIVSANANWAASGWNIADSFDGSVLRAFSNTTTALTMIDKSTARAQTITFDRRGFLVAPTTAIIMDVCKESGEKGRQILLNVTGRVDLNPDFICP